MTRYILVCKTIRGHEEFPVSDPEIKGDYLIAQFFKKPMSKTRMCRTDDIISLTIKEDP